MPTNLDCFSVLSLPLIADNLISDEGRTLLLKLLGFVVSTSMALVEVAGGANVEKLLPAEEEKEAFLGIYIVVTR